MIFALPKFLWQIVTAQIANHYERINKHIDRSVEVCITVGIT